MLAPKYELDRTTQYLVIAIFIKMRYVTLWPWPLTFWPWSLVTWFHLGGQSLYQVSIGYDISFQSYEDYNFLLSSSFKSQFFLTFLGVKAGSKFKFHLSNPQKKLPWRERHMRGDVSIDATWWRKKKRTETFTRQTGYLPRPPTLTLAPEILHAGSCPGSSYIFQVSWESVEGSRSCGVENRPLPLSRPCLIQQLALPYKPW